MLIGMSGITFFSVASAQSNNVYMEMMGPTILGMTINYERIIADNIAIRVGYGSGNKEKIYQGYYKHLNKLGYEKSFEQNFGVTPSEFYKEFDDFLNKSDEAKQNILKVN